MTSIIVGFAGRQGAGKSSAAAYLRERHGFAGRPVTDPMDEMLAPLLRRLNVPDHEIMPRLKGAMKNAPLPNHPWLTGRKLKQAIGREFRDAVGRPLPDGKPARTFFHDLWYEDNADHDRLVHDSVRYDFEGESIRQKKGYIIKLVDPEAALEDGHESETSPVPFDFLIENRKDGFEKLHAELDRIMDKILPANDWSSERTIGGDVISSMEIDIGFTLNRHGALVRAVADRLDGGDSDLEDIIDDVICDIKGHIGASLANSVADKSAEDAIAAGERYVTDEISNSTSDRLVAAAMAFLGVEEAKALFGIDA